MIIRLGKIQEKLDGGEGVRGLSLHSTSIPALSGQIIFFNGSPVAVTGSTS